jgi:glycosyltransferase involved in cell wall biosynthesis
VRIFDTRWMGPHGIGRFASELYRRLPGFQGISLDGRPSSPLDPWRLAGYLRTERPDLFLSPGYNAPAGRGHRFGLTVHDLNHLRVSENSSMSKRLYYRAVMRPAIHRATIVLTVSEFSKREICEWAEVEESRVVNVGNGVSAEFTVDGAKYESRDARPYLLFVGNYKPHKNFERILRAFARTRAMREFVLVGTGNPPTWVSKLVIELGLEGNIEFTGPISDRRLATLYRGATLLVGVSTYEGFGLPMIEAMACGSPVIASDAAAIPEVTGGAALLVNPCDIDSIASAIDRVAEDRELRAVLSARGLSRASHFSWDRTAARVIAAISACA